MRSFQPKNLDPKPFQKAILGWYDQYKRDLPWRRTSDPYAIFVSEMMLQQTQVKTVIPFYERFLKELPNWKALANAKEEKVLKLWEGLGYYRRARNLKAAAQKIVQEHGGKLPDSLETILELPGVGLYSAGAVLSIAFQKPQPLVDGNVIRVFSRIYVLRGNLKAGEGHQRVWEVARQLIPQQRPGDFNQALMELGATLCLPDNPQCLLCPMMGICEASLRGLQSELPEMPKTQETVEVSMAALLISRRNRLLVKKRSADEKWLKGMWEFPSMEGETFEQAKQKLEKTLKAKAEKLPLYEIKHQITHHKVTLRLYPAAAKKIKTGANLKWVSLQELNQLPFSSAQSKLRQGVVKSQKPQKSKAPIRLTSPS